MRSVLLPLAGWIAAALTGANAASAPPPKPTVPAPAVPAPEPARADAPEVRVQGHRIVLEKLTQVQNLGLDWGSDAPGVPTGSQHLYLHLAVLPPTPAQAMNIEGLDPNVVVSTRSNASLALRAYPSEDSNPVGSGVWRVMLLAQPVELTATQLRGLHGELILYPQARIARFEFPLTAKAPLVRESDRVKVTLREIRGRDDNLSLSFRMEWPAGTSVTRPNPENAYGVYAVGKGGTPVLPNTGGINVSQPGAPPFREIYCGFSDLKEKPSKVVVEALVRSGATERLPFTLPDIPLPIAAGGQTGNLPDDLPPLPDLPGALAVENGGSLTFTAAPRAGAPAQRVWIGLSRREGSDWGPWRWLDSQPDRDGTVRLNGIREGHYRVARGWIPAGALRRPDSTLVTGAVEVDVSGGKVTRLPALGPESVR
jgi:hypothetical protein